MMLRRSATAGRWDHSDEQGSRLCYNQRFQRHCYQFMDLNRKILAPRPLAWLILFAGLTVLTSCGSNYNNGRQNTGAISKFKHRVFVTNSFAGTILIFNAETNVIYNRPLGTSSGNNLM